MWIVICGVVAFVLLLASLGAWRKHWEIDDTPTSTCRGVFVGRNEVVGRVAPLYGPITTPFTSTPAVWFEWHLERWQSNDDGGSWNTVERRSTAAPFWLEDDTGRVLVRPRNASLEVDRSLCEELKGAFAPPYSRWQLRQWVLAGEDVIERQRSLADPAFEEVPTSSGWFTAGTGEPVSALRGRNRITERVLAVGTPVYVLGEVRPRSDDHGLELVGGVGVGELMITTKAEAEVSRSSARSAWVMGLAGLAASALFAGGVSNAIFDRVRWSWPIALVAAELALLVAITLARNYNRQVQVKEQAAKAWSLIDVSLRRRADLLPNLAAVAAAYADHEAGVQAVVADLRAQAATLPEPTQALPADPTLVVAEATDRRQRAAAAQAFALGEANPQLKADAVFVDLQRRITDAEEAVASARHFYNQAINVLRDRRQQLPGSLFARLVPVPTWRLFEAEEAARATPAVPLVPPAADASAGGGPR